MLNVKIDEVTYAFEQKLKIINKKYKVTSALLTTEN